MGHQGLTLLHVQRELILYFSSNCVSITIHDTSGSSGLGVSTQTVSQQQEQIEPLKTNDLCKNKRSIKF